MIISKKSINHNILFGFILAFLFSFLAYIPLPSPINTGLDPSWKYAISRAAAEKLVFGKDIIFTYGKFGYLIHGDVIDSNFLSIFLFRFIVHSTLFILTIVKSLELQTNLQKILLYISVVLTYLTGVSTDYQIVFSFIIILSFNKIWQSKLIHWWSLTLGAFTGFFLLTKFTLGVSTIGSLILFLFGNIYNSLKSKSRILISFTSVLNVVIGFMSVAFLLVDNNYLLNLKSLFVWIFYASSFSLLIWFLQKVLTNFSLSSVEETRKSGWFKKLYKNILSSEITGWIIFYLSYCLCLSIAVFYTSPALLNFLKGSLQISSGYSSAMSIVGSSWELGLAISQIILILALLITLVKENQNNLSLALSLAFIIWLSFRHGFTRQDSGHVLIFFNATPLIVALCISHLKQMNTAKISLLIHTYAVLILLGTYPFVQNNINALYPSNFLSKISTVINLNKLKENINAASVANLANIKLPENIINKLEGKTTDIFPWEISLVEANKLNWKPRPIIQSYSAYTKFLDQKNFQSISEFPRDYILYDFLSIDGRHPFFDEPATFFHIFCNYKFTASLHDFTNSDLLNNMMILEQRGSNVCYPGNITQKITMNWKIQQSLKLENSSLIRAKIKFKYSIFGKLYKNIFRSPPVNIQVNYINGGTSKYRIIPENSENGIIISHLPINPSEALSFFQGKLPIKIKSFSFTNSNSLLYLPDIEVSFIPYTFADSSIKQKMEIDISELKNINFKKDNNAYLSSFDSNNENIYYKKNNRKSNWGYNISFYGWAIKKSNPEDQSWILITSGNSNKPITIIQTGRYRPDVAKHFQNDKYSNSGWSIEVASETLGRGIYDFKAWIYNPATNSAIPIIGTYHTEIK
ncbi:hypothetical protein [uncultured Nostoc sp.]|uniref:hypothetical protein n=1 Tax=uncultured Nostoc sp. TaxID=340711 RepID=UPI0035CA6128